MFLFIRIAIYPILNFTEDHFHKNGLRTGPATKYPAKYNCEQDYKNNERKKANGKNEKILRPEGYPEKDKFPFQYIEHEYRGIMHLDERKCKKYQQIENTEGRSQVK